MSQPPPPTYVAAVDPREQVQTPGLLLMIVGIVGAVLQVLSVLLNMVGVGVGAIGASEAPEFVTQMMSGVVGIIFSVVAVAVGVFIAYAGMQMRQLRNYTLSMIGAIVAMIPCLSPCCCLGLPVGIWCLVVLFKPGVRDAFV